jgi:aryl-alcohol dehydrogenase-like predicted oxidoreductase
MCRKECAKLMGVGMCSQEESSEEVTGEWAEARGNRDQLFLATKYSVSPKYYDDAIAQKVLYGGNNAKALYLNIEASLKKLRTTYVDLLYVHYWDYTTGVEELMRALHGLVLARKVIYLVR